MFLAFIGGMEEEKLELDYEVILYLGNYCQKNLIYLFMGKRRPIPRQIWLLMATFVISMNHVSIRQGIFDVAFQFSISKNIDISFPWSIQVKITT